MLSTKILQLEQNVIQTLNESNLDLGIVELLMHKILKQVEEANQQKIVMETNQIRNSKEQETTEDTKE